MRARKISTLARRHALITAIDSDGGNPHWVMNDTCATLRTMARPTALRAPQFHASSITGAMK